MKPHPTRRRVCEALDLMPLDPPFLIQLLTLSPSTVYRALEQLLARGLITPDGHQPRRRPHAGGIQSLRWRRCDGSAGAAPGRS